MKVKSSKFVIIAEILFILLPLIIVITFNVLKSDFSRIFSGCEWIFGAIIFWGQSLVKFISGLIKSNKKFKWQNVSLIISLIIVIGIVPSTIILIVLLSYSKPTISINIMQYSSFLLSIIVYYYLGVTAQTYLDE